MCQSLLHFRIAQTFVELGLECFLNAISHTAPVVVRIQCFFILSTIPAVIIKVSLNALCTFTQLFQVPFYFLVSVDIAGGVVLKDLVRHGNVITNMNCINEAKAKAKAKDEPHAQSAVDEGANAARSLTPRCPGNSTIPFIIFTH